MEFADYIAFRSNPSNDTTTDGMWCGAHDKDIAALRKWKADNPQVMFTILAKRRSAYAEQLIEVDQALFLKAKAGDPRSIELLWSRFENWTPKIEETNAKQGQGKNKTLADLMEEL